MQEYYYLGRTWELFKAIKQAQRYVILLCDSAIQLLRLGGRWCIQWRTIVCRGVQVARHTFSQTITASERVCCLLEMLDSYILKYVYYLKMCYNVYSFHFLEIFYWSIPSLPKQITAWRFVVFENIKIIHALSEKL